MAGKDNLKVPSSEKAREIGRKGGKKSGEAKRARKTMREQLLLMLEKGDTQENMTLALIAKAMQGDVRAFEVIRDTIGEKPVDKQDVLMNGTVDGTIKVVLTDD